MADAVPSLEQLQSYSVNRPGWEVVRQTLYDSSAYAAAGATSLSFFSTPIGQGTGLGGGVKTITDTNMNLAGQLPANQYFLIESVELLIETATPTVAAGMPSAFGAQLAATSLNDMFILRRAGHLNLTIGSKSYLDESPLMKFPAKVDYDINAALADVTTAGANLQSRIAYGRAVGRPYMLKPASIFLQSNQNFSITLSWPEGLQAITNPARIVCSLDGFLYRKSQ